MQLDSSLSSDDRAAAFVLTNQLTVMPVNYFEMASDDVRVSDGSVWKHHVFFIVPTNDVKEFFRIARCSCCPCSGNAFIAPAMFVSPIVFERFVDYAQF